MPVNKIKKVNLVVHDSVYSNFISKLQEAGIIHIDDQILEQVEKELNIDKNDFIIENEDKLKNYISIIDKLFERSLSISIRFQNTWRGEIVNNFISKIEILSKPEFYRLLNDFDYEKILNELNKLLDEEKNLLSEIEKYQSRLNALLPIVNLPIALESIRNTGNCYINLFTISVTKLNQFREELGKSNIEPLYQIYYVSIYEGNIFFILVSYKDIYNVLYQLIKKHGGEEYIFAETNGTISENIEKYKKLIEENNYKIEEIYNSVVDIIEVYGKSIKVFYDEVFTLFGKGKIEQKLLKTETTKIIIGWVLEKDIEEFKKIINNYPYIIYDIKEPDENDQPPVELKNKKIVEPYELLTELYSLPKYEEIDPTPLMAPVFPILFGICLGDAGYGFLVFIVSLILIKKFNAGKLINVLFQSSIFTMIFGVLTGTYFGTILNLLRESFPKLASFIDKFIWFDPLSNPMKLLVFALQIGIVEIAFSFLVAFYTQIKSKQYIKAFTQTLAYFFIIITGSFLVSTLFGFSLPSLVKTIFAIIALICVLSLLIFSANEEKSAFEKGIGKFFAIYNIFGIMGDILSFSRLLALGLSTSVIAMVANITAQILRGSKFNLMSWFLSLIPLLMIHGINLALGLLGSFVHSMRLQFVEFFKNFYEGGGKKWSPFKRVHKYSVIAK